MSELKAILGAARPLRERGAPLLLATVVAVRGSAYRRPGARMLADTERWLAGSLSGGCVERMVLNQGWFRTRAQRAVLASYEQAEHAREGSGCEGEIDVLIERLEQPSACDPLRFAERCLNEERSGLSATVVRSVSAEIPVGARMSMLAPNSNAGLHAWEVACDCAALSVRLESQLTSWQAQPPGRRGLLLAHADLTLFVEWIAPPPHLFVFGSAHDATTLIALASQLGWSVTAWDGKPSAATRERLRAADHYRTGPVRDFVAALDRCGASVAVVMGHDYAQDREVLAALLPSRARYVGVLGPRARSQQLVDDCADEGVVPDAAMRARLFGPAGLSLGAETPAEIALSILAQAQGVLAGQPLRALRDVAGAIHAEPEAACSHQQQAPADRP